MALVDAGVQSVALVRLSVVTTIFHGRFPTSLVCGGGLLSCWVLALDQSSLVVVKAERCRWMPWSGGLSGAVWPAFVDVGRAPSCVIECRRRL